jgi:curved DNA-binding protein CbpA
MLNDFQTLGISSSASIAEIKKAYRLKAKEFHPDVNDSPDAAEKFRNISEAYQRIIDFREGRHSYQQPSIDYEAILREKARAHARMRYQEWKQKLEEEEKNKSIHEIYWGKNVSYVLLLITLFLLTDQFIGTKISVEKIIKTNVTTDEQLYYTIETEHRKIEIISDWEIEGLELNSLIMVGETPLLHSLKEIRTIQNKVIIPDNIVGNFTPALIINLILLLFNFYYPLKTYHQKLWIKTLLIISSLYYLVSFLQAQH